MRSRLSTSRSTTRPVSFILALALLTGLLGVTLVAPAELAAQPAEEVEDTEATSDGEAGADGEDAEDAEDAEESKHGTYEWKFAWGAGIEYGFFVTELDRWDTNLLEPNGQNTIDSSFMGIHDLAVEVYPLEGLRLTAFGGVTSVYQDDPSLLAWYAGLEPAFTVRRSIFELSAGVGVAGGKMELETADGEASAVHVLVRPFIEPRVYPTDWMAIFLRFGFNLFTVVELESDAFELPSVAGDRISEDNLSEAGFYTSLGLRFGSYPEHLAVVEDSDGDTYRDDIDDCPQQAEDFDQFEDADGCPDDDNDKDGIADKADQCPDQPEDPDGWQDEDGCPETDDDTDGDGFLNPVDACPEQPEDIDQFEDTDGCPEEDNDKDGILDGVDLCPNEAGVPEKQGCPIRRVEVTLEAIVITEKIFFELDKAIIKPESFDLLNEIATVIKDNPRIKRIEIGGHTDTAGKDKYNLKLSGERAAAVRDYLIGQGVEAERLEAKGYGETKPLVATPAGEKETEDAAAANRRVEFLILEQDEVKQIVPEDQLPPGAEPVNPQ